LDLFDLEVKGQGPTKVITVRDTPPYGHAPTYQLSLTYLERQKSYGPDKKILFKKQLFDLEVKGQGPQYHLSLTYLERQKCYGQDKKIIFKKQLFDLDVKGQGPMKVIMVRDTLPYSHAPTYQLSLTYLERQKCYGPDKKILFKKQLYLKVKVPRRSLRYTTHRLMVMHPHTKYH
jgi:hypothetical protein